ncbi:Type II secretion system protein E [Halioglobus japonicus]|nr:Type II secretion system protein E [Halioglobus japonicus]
MTESAELVAADAPVASAPVRPAIPFTFAQQHGVLLDATDEGAALVVHLGEPKITVLTELRRMLGAPFALQSVPESDFKRRLTLAYQRNNNEAVQMAEDIGADVDLSRLADAIPDAGDLMDTEDDAPIIRLINAVLSQAVREQASDIHIETFEDRLSVRYRIDGVLAEVLSPKRMLAPLLVSRLKVMARLDIAEKRVPQDGRISVKIAGHAVDIRMSTIPSAHGERVVLRLLDTAAGQLQLTQLAMNEQVLKAFNKHLHSPHGIILVTGPTGSGKTTTLYAGLGEINETSRNILTIEDPVEYMLPGIGQTQVNSKVDMTFARGLRAILRQDPDVVMVGEIRDLETAEIAVQASLTGHLVLSTLHTNTAVGAITRLKDMGIEPFLLSSSLIAVMAQRLVRLLCNECKEQAEPNSAERELLRLGDDEKAVSIYHAKGCERCKYTGYHGRTGIYEMVEIDDDVRQMVYESANEQDILKVARIKYPGIESDGRRRILAGETSIEEVMRVTSIV